MRIGDRSHRRVGIGVWLALLVSFVLALEQCEETAISA